MWASRSATASPSASSRTLKEECIHLHDFETLEEAREVTGAFIERYNNGWLLQRHGYLTPSPRPREAQPQGGLMFRPSPCPENRVRYRRSCPSAE